jgi:hypothetical protein
MNLRLRWDLHFAEQSEAAELKTIKPASTQKNFVHQSYTLNQPLSEMVDIYIQICNGLFRYPPMVFEAFAATLF